MRILWISFLGSWTLPLLNALSSSKKEDQYGLLIPTTQKNEYKHLQLNNNCKYYTVYLTTKELYSNMEMSVFDKYKTYIKQFSPDIIHIHGTEKNLAQIQNFIQDIPVVISIQGIMQGYKKFSFNYLLPNEEKKYKTLKNYLGRGGINQQYKLFCQSKFYEKNIFKNGIFFIGRTEWDKAQVIFRNKQAKYFHGEELLRPEFYFRKKTWAPQNCEPYTIFMPSGFNPIKGLHIALEAITLLKERYPTIKLYVPGIPQHIIKKNKLSSYILGEQYINIIKEKIRKNNLTQNIKLLPRLSASEMINYMQKSQVFLSPTSIDNSPNTIGEAMMIGIPIVTTAVGGILSFLKDKETCLLAPAGDEYVIAYKIMQLFEDQELSQKLSNNAYLVALQRHNIETTILQYREIYLQCINTFKKK